MKSSFDNCAYVKPGILQGINRVANYLSVMHYNYILIRYFLYELRVTFCFLDCSGSFELLLRKGYLKNGFIEQPRSDHGQCACGCNDNIDCIAYTFRYASKRCFFHVNVSDLKENVTDSYAWTYIKKHRGKHL